MIDDAVSTLADRLSSGPLASNGEPLLQQLKEIQRLSRELLEPLDEETLESTEDALTELLHDLDPVPLPLQSLRLHFARVMRGWLRSEDEETQAETGIGLNTHEVPQLRAVRRRCFSSHMSDSTDCGFEQEIAERLQEIVYMLKSACMYVCCNISPRYRPSSF